MLIDIILLTASAVYIASIVVILIVNDKINKDKEQQQKEFMQDYCTTAERKRIYEYENIKGHLHRNKRNRSN